MTIPLEGYRDIVNPQQCPTKNAYFGFIEHFWDCGTTQPGWPIIHTITPIPPVTPPPKKLVFSRYGKVIVGSVGEDLLSLLHGGYVTADWKFLDA